MIRAKNGKRGSVLGTSQGFTMIEMAIVLIIIGIIIGAVVKGKDLIRGGEQKKLYSKFLQSWELAYNAYYDRTAWILGDVNDSVNGAIAGGRDGHCSDPSEANIVAQLEAVGLEAPAKGPTGSRLVRTYTDSTGRSNTLTIAFDFRLAQGNHIRVESAPNELGIAWDTLVDGENSGDTGDLLYVPDHTAVTLSPAIWPSAQVVPSANAAAILRLQF
jgi:prepilin-type N-terminal cleavage/methylation domain-containing protein